MTYKAHPQYFKLTEITVALVTEISIEHDNSVIYNNKVLLLTR